MNIVCIICSDLINQTENTYVTQCGHIFHHHCLVQWIERSKTCPQCRNKVTDRCMFRLYPTVSNENTRVDAATLQTRLDDAELQLRQQRFKHKEKEDKIIALTTDLKSQVELLKSYEMQLVSFDTKVMSLSEQLEHAQLQNKDLLQLKDENESLKKSMQALNSIQKLLNSTIEEVDQMLQGCSDVRTLATFVTALKRTLWESESKQNEIKSLLHEVNKKLSLERNDSAKLQKIILQLETKLHGVRTQYEILKKDRDLEQQVKEEEKRMNDVMQSSPSDLNAARLKAASTTSLEPFTPIRLPRPPYALPLNIQSSANPFLNTIQNSLMEIKSLDWEAIPAGQQAKAASLKKQRNANASNLTPLPVRRS